MSVATRHLLPRPARRPGSARREAERERRLLFIYFETGDVDVRAELIERFLPLARDLAQRYRHLDEPLEDLVQVASLGLMKALDRFDPYRTPKFSSYAAPTILGELKRHFRDKSWAVHLPRELQERALLVTRETEALTKELHRSPTPREVAAALGLSVESVLEAREASIAYGRTSLDAAVGDDEGSAPLIELIGRDDDHFDLVAERAEMASSWTGLSDVEREILRLRFVDDLTQREIGRRVGYSQMHVSRLLRAALARMSVGQA